MKKIFLLLAVVAGMAFTSCEGDQGPPGEPGQPDGDTISEAFELRNVNFTLNNGEYSIYQTLNPPIFLDDVILIYRLSGTINSSTPVWQLIPRTLYVNDVDELDYDYDFSMQDFTIYAGGNYNLAQTPQFLNNQTFRIVIVPAQLSNKMAKVDSKDFEAVKTALKLTENDFAEPKPVIR